MDTATDKFLDTPSAEKLEFSSNPDDYKQPLRWLKVFHMLLYHAVAIYGLITAIGEVKWATLIFIVVHEQLTLLGFTAGAHRLWTHRSYSAKTPLRILLAILYYSCTQQSIAGWVLDHKVHHKYTDLPPDPYNASRGFFYSHIGWLVMKKSPLTIKCGRQIDMSYVYNDPVVKFCDKYKSIIRVSFVFIVPVLIPVYGWNERLKISFLFNAVRILMVLHTGLCVNSIAHLWGVRPYNKNITPVESRLVSFISLGEGWHNYHHMFPWDYKTSESSGYKFNLTTGFIDLMAWLGLAYDLKTAKNESIASAYLNNGDGNTSPYGYKHD